MVDETDVQHNANTLTARQISAAVMYLKTASNSKKHRKKSVYKDALGNNLSAELLNVITARKWLRASVSAKLLHFIFGDVQSFTLNRS